MIKRIFLVLAMLTAATVAHAAGTISLSLSQQFDSSGKPLSGCYLYFYQAGTVSTPKNAYQDTNLTILQPNPMRCDAAGRLGQFFLADGQIKIRLTDVNGVTQVVADNILVIGPSAGGGGGGSVDATTVFATGDVKQAYGNSILTGWVRLNGRTIGSATSGATERANADAQALFTYLWGADSNLTVSGGRGASAAADWSANKTITLPDARNRAFASLGDMGSIDANLFAGSTFAYGTGITLGARLGIGTPKTIARSDLPNVSPTFTGTTQTWTINQNVVNFTAAVPNCCGGGVTTVPYGQSQPTVTVTPSGTIQSLNGGVTQTTFDTVSPFILVTSYIKL
jgi:hypothetical protein